MAQFNPDDKFEKFMIAISPVWGPFYAVFYILRLLWKEWFHKEEKP